MRTKSSILTKLKIMLEDSSSEEIVELLGNNLSTMELEDLLTSIEEDND